ncbi:tetratricopeptide repeat protein [Streptomyces sp. NPDC051287]|uniref:tetratricopeptide repeat protein n=1 Tax=Streptomyces sp. NPDC051287 TaxID=3365648 RepID=UPI00379775C2
MSRLSRETKREAQQTDRSAEPVEVRVTGGAATVDGVPLFPAPGEEPQQAVLNHLQRLALAAGRPALATVHDSRIGYVVRLQVNPDGSSSFTGEPVRMAVPGAPAPSVAPAPAPEPVRRPGRDRSALHAVAEPEAADPAPAHRPPVAPAPRLLGTVQPPTGVFGPPPVMDGPSAPAAVPAAAPAVAPAPAPAVVPAPAPAPAVVSAPAPAPAVVPAQAVTGPSPVSRADGAGPRVEPVTAPPAPPPPVPAPLVEPVGGGVFDPDPRHTPARGFDAVAEEVLGDEPVTVTAEGAALLTEPVSRINEAVRAGRIEAAADLAERTVAEAGATLGEHHTEVLHLRELTAYIAYLAGDPLRAFHLSLDLARQHRRAGDGEGAYGNVRSAATAWRAVRDPEHGLRLGRDLIDLWAQLTTEDGPAAGEPEELDSARARMGRLTERARRAAERA